MGIPYAEVIGDPIAHSKSPLIHKFWLEKLGLDADFRAVRVAARELQTYLEQRRGDPDWRGASVTSPLKQAVLPLLTTRDSSAATVSASNLIVREDEGRIVGYNSDGAGFLEPLRSLLAEPHLFRMARVFGAGGAARAVAHALATHGFTLVLVARDVAKAEEIIATLPGEHHAAPLAHFSSRTDFVFDDRRGLLDLVVNTTPLGMSGQPPLPLDWSHVPPGSIVYDLVYSPLETPLMSEARARGHRTISGLHMLIGQAAVAFEHLFGQPAPRQHDPELWERLTS